MKQPLYLSDLPDEDLKGPGMKPTHDYTKNAGRIALKYASITSLAISLITIAMAVA